jgi:hypothetical protein
MTRPLRRGTVLQEQARPIQEVLADIGRALAMHEDIKRERRTEDGSKRWELEKLSSTVVWYSSIENSAKLKPKFPRGKAHSKHPYKRRMASWIWIRNKSTDEKDVTLVSTSIPDRQGQKSSHLPLLTKRTAWYKRMAFLKRMGFHIGCISFFSFATTAHTISKRVLV